MWRWFTHNHQTLTGIGAMLVGIAALFVAWDQGRVMRAQQHGAVYPVLQVDGFVSTMPNEASLGITIANNGVGPALIRRVSLYRDGELQPGLDSYRAQLPEGYNLSWAGLTGRALAPNESVTPIQIRWARTDITQSELYEAATSWDAWEVRVCYCSVFDRCWETTPAGGALARRVHQCEVGAEDAFEQLGAATPTPISPETATLRPEDAQ
ncbi:hypothetical protein [uncultured Maricaulis sp.]|uniref:hypothetical protein n=1 Tax=uncultured Maricaulis sp. TaxID=174710 RepID=UPI0030DBE315|tara:strand:- start:9917 stop:10546 length:630 start_codon:yes stop_codon:yes gene_type:complete